MDDEQALLDDLIQICDVESHERVDFSFQSAERDNAILSETSQSPSLSKRKYVYSMILKVTKSR